MFLFKYFLLVSCGYAILFPYDLTSAIYSSFLSLYPTTIRFLLLLSCTSPGFVFLFPCKLSAGEPVRLSGSRKAIVIIHTCVFANYLLANKNSKT